jgi:histidyl-tRNA synthetase
MTNLPQPVRLYYLASIFRYERPQAGRYREHYQFGCEALGDGEPTLDAEVIDMAWQLFAALGLRNLILKLNSIGCRGCRSEYLASLKKHYSEHTQKLCKDCNVRLERNPLRLLDCKKPQCQEVAELAPKSVDYLCPECGEHFSRLRVYLELLGLPYEVSHRLVRGLDYYTRTVFEIQPESEGAQSTLGGGGRYDDLISELGGKPTSAIGFASGIERIILNLKKQGVSVPSLPQPWVFVAYVGDKARDEAVALTARLRRAGIGVIGATGSRSLKAQLRQANALACGYTVIIGDEEIKAKTVIMRNMTTSVQETVPRARLEARLITDLEQSELGRL